MQGILACGIFYFVKCSNQLIVCVGPIVLCVVVQLACTIHCSWILDVRNLCKYAYFNSTSKILVPISCQCRCEQAFDTGKCVHVQVVILCLQLSILFSRHIPLWIHTFIQAIHKVMFWSSQLSMLLLCRDHSLWLQFTINFIVYYVVCASSCLEIRMCVSVISNQLPETPVTYACKIDTTELLFGLVYLVDTSDTGHSINVQHEK